MPECTWKEIDDAIHSKRNILVKIAGAKKLLLGITKDIESDISRLNDIVLRQPEEEKEI